MRRSAYLVLIVCSFLRTAAMAQLTAQGLNHRSDPLLQKFLSKFDLAGTTFEADQRLHLHPNDVTALTVRMEAAELQERPGIVLDSALRLCALPGGGQIQELASNRVLQHAGNTRVFNSVLRRVRAIAALNSSCTFNLKLALVAAAMDGSPGLEVDKAAQSAGLLTQWQIVGPFGQYNNLDFERHWQAELDQLSRTQYGNDGAFAKSIRGGKKKAVIEATRTLATERFWFRNGMLSLPDYLSGPGVLYAASDVEIRVKQTFQIEILSAGTYAAFIDGKQVMLHDRRLASGPNQSSVALQLGPGRHRVLIKFTADAAPLSVGLHPKYTSPAERLATPEVLNRYVAELVAYFRGDFIGMERMLSADSEKNTALAQYLHALLYSAAEEHSPRADAAWKNLAQAQPAALLAHLKSDESTAVHGQSEEVLQKLTSILAQRPDSEMVLELAFNQSRGQSGASALLTHLLELHPSCDHLAEAIKFYSAVGEQARAAQSEQKLANCAPESLKYPRTLSESGRHSAAAAYLQQLIAKNPLDRAARRMLIEQLVDSGQKSAALLQAKQLHALAPNSLSYALLAQNPDSILDSRSERGAGFATGEEFYVPYRRDGLELVRSAAKRRFSGGSAVILLSDKVVSIGLEGQVSIYVHRIIRPLNKDGISHYGEVTLPRGAYLLELRTIKASGQIIEPELSQEKSSVSMPTLDPGDSIEEEYVIHYFGLEFTQDNPASITFGSFDAPILFSRLVVLNPSEVKLDIREQAGAPQGLVGQHKGTVIHIWQRDDIAQTTTEPFLPPFGDLLPTVAVSVAEKGRDSLRDRFMDATRIGSRVEETAQELLLPQTTTDIEKARRLYRFVTTKLESTGPDWASSPAEETLQSGQGSRTSVLLALARATGLKANLILARKVGQRCSGADDISCYSEPLVRFWFANGEIYDVDAEADDLAFGATSPMLETHDAHVVSLTGEDGKKPETTALFSKEHVEKTTAEANVSFHEGNLIADLQIQLGSARGHEIRSLLRNPNERQLFFEQLAMRLFPGATTVAGSSRNEDDPEHALEITLHCSVPQFLNPKNNTFDLGQLAAPLGLRMQYVKAPVRKFPLYIESLFFESATFHLHLPENLQVVSIPKDFAEGSEFGEYSVRFAQTRQSVDIYRDFHIPVQIISPEKYAAFSEFAQHIDDAERQHISMESGKDTLGQHQYRVPPATGMLR